MMKTILTLVFTLTISAVSAQSVVKGYVFEDLNGNKKKDRREKGIAGVSVSNGINVTQTDNNGAYTLPIGNDNIIFVIKPSGYRVPVNDKNQPQFYYIHKPAGHPEGYKYKGTPPTGKLPALVNFPLVRHDESAEFTALVFGDPQPYTMEEVKHFSRGIVEEVAGINNVEFGLSLGDLVGDNLDLHNPYIDAVKGVGIPWYNLMGNHDMNYEAKADSLSDETYEYHFGPANYSFNYGNVHFIILDDILYPDPRDGAGYWGGFRKSQLAFIENDLKFVDKQKLIVLAFHIPLYTGTGSFNPEHRQKLFDLLKDYPNTLSLSAHSHLQRNLFYTKADGWHQSKPHHEYNAGTTSGDWYSGELDEKGVPYSTMRDGTPKGYAFIHFKDNKYVIDYKVAGKPKDYQMEIYSPKVIPQGRTSAGIYVNFFMGSARDVVEYRIGNRNWEKMTHIEDNDPSFLALLYKWDNTETLMPGRRPSNAVKCTHLWRAGFPRDLPLGEHTIEVRVTDMFGRQFTQTRKIKVETPVAVE
jgi:hypothetical protein